MSDTVFALLVLCREKQEFFLLCPVRLCPRQSQTADSPVFKWPKILGCCPQVISYTFLQTCSKELSLSPMIHESVLAKRNRRLWESKLIFIKIEKHCSLSEWDRWRILLLTLARMWQRYRTINNFQICCSLLSVKNPLTPSVQIYFPCHIILITFYSCIWNTH